MFLKAPVIAKDQEIITVLRSLEEPNNELTDELIFSMGGEECILEREMERMSCAASGSASGCKSVPVGTASGSVGTPTGIPTGIPIGLSVDGNTHSSAKEVLDSTLLELGSYKYSFSYSKKDTTIKKKKKSRITPCKDWSDA